MRTDKELDGILRFMLRADKLKEIERTGWLISKVKNPEHDGDHSCSAVISACQKDGTISGKVCRNGAFP